MHAWSQFSVVSECVFLDSIIIVSVINPDSISYIYHIHEVFYVHDYFMCMIIVLSEEYLGFDYPVGEKVLHRTNGFIL